MEKFWTTQFAICQFVTIMVQEEEGLSCPDNIQLIEPYFYCRFLMKPQEEIAKLEAHSFVMNWLKEFRAVQQLTHLANLSNI